jgi:hypothetical protein
MNKLIWMVGLVAVCGVTAQSWAQDAAMPTPDTTASGFDVNKGQMAATDQVKVIMPDGNTLTVNNYADNPWWKDARLQGYTRYVFDPEQNAYKMMKDGDNSDAKPFCEKGKKKDWCQ